MYVWMLLATFIVMLATFNLSPRSDIHHIQQAPLAEAAITKFLVLHGAAIKYVKREILACHSNPDDCVLPPGVLTVCEKDEENHEVGELCPYLPVGFNPPEASSSRVFCLNRTTYKTETDSEGNPIEVLDKLEGTEPAESCFGENSAIYLVSYMQVPPRWRNVANNRILPEFYYAMRKTIAVGSSCGVVTRASPESLADEERNPLGSENIIEGADVRNKSIPEYVAEFSSNDFKIKDDCFTWDSDVNGFAMPCVIYVTKL